MGQFLPDVRTYPGVPPVSIFSSITGTPIVVDTLTSIAYYLSASNVVTPISTVPRTAPAFSAYASAAQTLPGSALTQVILGTEEFDTDSYFASSRFSPLVAGYYQVNWHLDLTNSPIYVLAMLFKNGVRYKDGSFTPGTAGAAGSSGSSLVFMNGSTDYLEIFGYAGSGSGVVNPVVSGTYFNGAWIRG